MRDKDLYAQILGIESPWQVSEVDLNVPKGEVTVRVEQEEGVKSCCPNYHLDTTHGYGGGGTWIRASIRQC